MSNLLKQTLKNINKPTLTTSETLERLKNYYNEIEGRQFFELAPLFKNFKNFNIFFILSKKDIGKSYQIIKLIKELKPGELVVYVRFLRDEIERTAAQWQADPLIPFFIRNMVIYSKNDKSQVLGYCFYINNLQASGSLEFANVSTVIVDEINPLNPQRFTTAKVHAFAAFLSNVERHKKGLRVLIFGNNHGQNALMDSLGVNARTEIKEIEYKTPSGEIARLLFLNLKNRFKGIESQAVTGLFLSQRPEAFGNMLQNAGDGLTSKLLDVEQLKHFKPLFRLIFELNQIYTLKIFKTEYMGIKYVFYALIKEAEFSTHGVYYSDKLALVNVYPNINYNNLIYFKNVINTLMRGKQLYYKNLGDLIEFTKYTESMREKKQHEQTL